MEKTPEIWFPHLGWEFEKIPRVFATVFNIPIYWYAICIVLGFLAAFGLALREAKRTGQNPDHYWDALFLGIPVSLVCTRLFYVVFNWDIYRNDLMQIFNVRDGGLAIFGGLIGAGITSLIISKTKKIPISLILDTCATSLLIGQILGRFGNFFNREAFGGYTDNPFAMRILANQAYYVTPEVMAHTVMARGAEYIQVHPAFLYEIAGNAVLILFLFWYRPRKKFPGEVIFLYMLGYGFVRFFIEGLRTDSLMFFGTGLRTNQISSAAFVVFAVGAIILGRLHMRKNARTTAVTASVPRTSP
jgi:phosphatidylglycerol:prolipoprotein diacylglycerol transferase